MENKLPQPQAPQQDPEASAPVQVPTPAENQGVTTTPNLRLVGNQDQKFNPQPQEPTQNQQLQTSTEITTNQLQNANSPEGLPTITGPGTSGGELHEVLDKVSQVNDINLPNAA